MEEEIKSKYTLLKNKDRYLTLLKSGMFWEYYPELSGNWDEDIKIILR